MCTMHDVHSQLVSAAHAHAHARTHTYNHVTFQHCSSTAAHGQLQERNGPTLSSCNGCASSSFSSGSLDRLASFCWRCFALCFLARTIREGCILGSSNADGRSMRSSTESSSDDRAPASCLGASVASSSCSHSIAVLRVPLGAPPVCAPLPLFPFPPGACTSTVDRHLFFVPIVISCASDEHDG